MINIIPTPTCFAPQETIFKKSQNDKNTKRKHTWNNYMNTKMDSMVTVYTPSAYTLYITTK